jgi:hypothetical protein
MKIAVMIGDISAAIVEINDFYGNFTVFTADTLTVTKSVKQKIPFGGTEYFEIVLERTYPFNFPDDKG